MALDLSSKEVKDRIEELRVTCTFRKMRITSRGRAVPEPKSCKYPKLRGRQECHITDHISECPIIRQMLG